MVLRGILHSVAPKLLPARYDAITKHPDTATPPKSSVSKRIPKPDPAITKILKLCSLPFSIARVIGVDTPDVLLVTENQLRTFPGWDTGALSLIGDEAKVNVICPIGYRATGCMGGTVPASLGNIQYAGGLESEGPLLVARGGPQTVSTGFNDFLGCLTSVRFDVPIPRDHNEAGIFVKAEAFCERIGNPLPPPVVDPVRLDSF